MRLETRLDPQAQAQGRARVTVTKPELRANVGIDSLSPTHHPGHQARLEMQGILTEGCFTSVNRGVISVSTPNARDARNIATLSCNTCPESAILPLTAAQYKYQECLLSS